jgi:hypothetical protein
MIKNKQFSLNTKFGNVAVKFNGVNTFSVGSRLAKESGYGDEEPFILTIRNKSYNYFSYHAGLNPATGLIDASTYDFNGNDHCFASKYPNNEYFKVKSLYFDATDAAKYALADEILIKLNEFYAQNKDEINKIWAEMGQEKLIEKISGLKSKISDLEKEIEAAQSEIAELSKNVGK